MKYLNKMEEKTNIKSLFYITRYLKPYKLYLLGVLISLTITSTCVLLISKAVKIFIDEGISTKNGLILNQALEYLIVIIIVLALFTFSRFFLVTFIGEKIVTDIRRDIFKHLLKLSPRFFEQNKAGDILSRISSDTTIILSVISSSLSMAMRNFIMLIGGIVLMVITSPTLAIFIFLLIPLIVVPIVILSKKLRVYSKRSQEKLGEITAYLEQSIYSLKIIQAYTMENYEIKSFDLKLYDLLKASLERITFRGILTAIVITLTFGGIAFILWVGGHQVLAGIITPGDLSAFIYIAIICAAAIAAISDIVGELQRAAAAIDRIIDFLSTKPDITTPRHHTQMPSNSKGLIKFNNVQFTYNKSYKTVLDNLAFKIPPGKITALVGKSGVGKSTVFMLLERFYDVSSGSITIDGIDIRSIDITSLRKQFTYVSQEPIVFASTVYENILYGNPNATLEDIKKAAKAAACDFIEKLPNGFNTYVGEKGAKLSGGQKQRIAIARAILHDPKILLLDEATSSLDSENEELVQKALHNLMKNRTTIVIAHRLSTVKNANNIIVLDKGKVAETGTHSSLLKKKGIYYKLAKLQFPINEDK